VEEARQYSSLSPLQWTYALLLFGGVVVFACGLALQFIIRGRALVIALTIYVFTRLLMAGMRVFAPGQVLGGKPNRAGPIAGFVAWLLISVLMAFVEMRAA
jgi:hypothetical protein